MIPFTYQVRVASVLVDHGVPDGMQVADAILAGDVLVVATFVAVSVVRVDEGSRVKRLVHISDVVDEQADREGALVLLVRELVRDLGNVCGLRGSDSSFEESVKIGDGLNDIDVTLVEIGEIRLIGAFLIVVRKVDEVPGALERVALALPVISFSCAFSEWVVSLICRQAGVVLSERLELIESSRKHIRVLLLKDCLSSAGD